MGDDAQYRPPPEFRAEVRALALRVAEVGREAARACGYCLVTHGSLERDVDLLAVPWVDDAVDAFSLVKAVQAAVSAEIGKCYRNHAPALKPHGRLAWIMYFQGAISTPTGAYPFIDLSVAPRLKLPPEPPGEPWAS